jgi:branched-chain amino acid transport system permease protein
MTRPSVEALGRMGRARGVRILVAGLAAAAIVLLPYQLELTWVRIALIALVWGVLASGLNILAGFCGLLDLGFVAFFAIGSYFSAIVTTRFVPVDSISIFVLAVDLLVGGLLAALAGGIIGYPTLRLRGDYLAIMTLGFGEVIRQTVINVPSLTNGPRGIRGIPIPSILGRELTSVESLFIFAAVLAALSLTLITRLLRSHLGRAWVAIREDEDVAESLGVPTARYKLYAYVCSAFFAGMMGVFFVHVQRFISPDSFNLFENIVILTLVVIGGLGSLAGPLLGAGVWFVSQEVMARLALVRANPETRQMILAAVLVGIMLLRPGGILGPARTLTKPTVDSAAKAGGEDG